MSKYNDFMSHVRVDDEMHRRVMSAVSKALDEQAVSKEEQAPAKAEITPVHRKAKIPVIRILSIAAAAILVSGVVYFAVRIGMTGSSKAATTQNLSMDQAVNAAATAAEEADNVNEGVAAAAGNDRNYLKSTKKGVQSGKKHEDPTEQETTAAAEESEETENIKGKDSNYNKSNNITALIPFKIKTYGAGEPREDGINSIFYTGENGEKLIIYFSKEGTDIAKTVYPEFKGIPAQLQTGNGLKFYAIDTSAGPDEQVGSSGPYDAVTWTNNGTAFMMVFGEKTDVNAFMPLMENI